jgi:hypothetical protein
MYKPFQSGETIPLRDVIYEFMLSYSQYLQILALSIKFPITMFILVAGCVYKKAYLTSWLNRRQTVSSPQFLFHFFPLYCWTEAIEMETYKTSAGILSRLKPRLTQVNLG